MWPRGLIFMCCSENNAIICVKCERRFSSRSLCDFFFLSSFYNEFWPHFYWSYWKIISTEAWDFMAILVFLPLLRPWPSEAGTSCNGAPASCTRTFQPKSARDNSAGKLWRDQTTLCSATRQPRGLEWVSRVCWFSFLGKDLQLLWHCGVGIIDVPLDSYLCCHPF